MFSTIAGWLAAIGVQPTHLIAGLAGGIVRALIYKEGTRVERIFVGAVGTLFAAFLTPFALLIFGATAPAISGAVGFMLGLMGMSFAIAFIKIGKDYANNPAKLKEDVLGFLVKVLTPKGDGK